MEACAAATPIVFLGHGGGPMPLIGHDGHRDLLRTWAPDSPLYSLLHSPDIKSIVVISAHHESEDGSVL